MTQRNIPLFIALGGNLPWNGKQSVDVLRAALEELARSGLAALKVSKFYATPCFPVGAGPDYVNAAAALQTDLPLSEILVTLHQVEAAFGRTRHRRWGGRTLDLDLLAVGDQVRPDRGEWLRWHALPLERQSEVTPETLILPHPRLQDRAFVLVPMMDIAPDWRHPVLNKTVAELAAALPKAAIDDVRAL